MKNILVFILLASSATAFSQDWPLKKMVTEQKTYHVPFSNVTPFSFTASKTLAQRGTYQELRLDPSFIKQLMAEKPANVHLSVPADNNTTIAFDLLQYSLGNIKFTENNDAVIADVKIPLTYKGIISEEQDKNIVTLTVNDEYLSLTAVTNNQVLQLTKGNETANGVYR